MKTENNGRANALLEKDIDLPYLHRCVQLAELSTSAVADNPRVGAVLVHRGRIIGEGYHHRAGQAHAEVNCLAAVSNSDRPLIPASTLYISLEPCCITGRSGACTDVIKRHRIKTVVFPQRDPTPGVAGHSVELLAAAGVTVREYPDFVPAARINRERAVMVRRGRPYVVLKYARSADGQLRPAPASAPYWITGPIARRLVHRWRARTSAILVGARTVIDDDPALTTRLFPGPNPVPVVVDLRNRVVGNERLFNGATPQTILFSTRPRPEVMAENIVLERSDLRVALSEIFSKLISRRLGRVTVEGGAALLNACLAEGLWDEARVFTGPQAIGEGLTAPSVPTSYHCRTERVGEDRLDWYEKGRR